MLAGLATLKPGLRGPKVRLAQGLQEGAEDGMGRERWKMGRSMGSPAQGRDRIWARSYPLSLAAPIWSLRVALPVLVHSSK